MTSTISARVSQYLQGGSDRRVAGRRSCADRPAWPFDLRGAGRSTPEPAAGRRTLETARPSRRPGRRRFGLTRREQGNDEGGVGVVVKRVELTARRQPWIVGSGPVSSSASAYCSSALLSRSPRASRRGGRPPGLPPGDRVGEEVRPPGQRDVGGESAEAGPRFERSSSVTRLARP